MILEDQVDHRLQIAVQKRDRFLRRETLGQGREATQVRHHHRDLAQLATERERLWRAQQAGHDVVGDVPAKRLPDERAARLHRLEIREIVRGADDASHAARPLAHDRAREENRDLAPVRDLVDHLAAADAPVTEHVLQPHAGGGLAGGVPGRDGRDEGAHRLPEQLARWMAEHGAGCGIDRHDDRLPPVGAGLRWSDDDHGIAHGIEDAVQVIARDRGALQIVCHPVEGRCDLADLVAPRLYDATREIALPEGAHPCDESADRRRERPREQHRHRDDERGDTGSCGHEHAPEGEGWRKGLRRVELRHDSPAKVRNRQRCVGGQDRLLPIVNLGDRPGPAAQGRQDVRGRDLLEEDGAPVSPHELDDLVGHARRRHRIQVLLRRLQKESRVAPHPVIRADEVGFTSLAQPPLFPLPVAGHDSVDSGERYLESEDAEPAALVEDRRRHERRRCAERGKIRLEVHELHEIGVDRNAGCPEGPAQPRIPIGSREDVRREVELLGHAVHDATGLVIDEKEVVVAGLTGDRAEDRIVPSVDVRISSGARRPVQAVARLLRVGVVRDKERLQRDRHILALRILAGGIDARLRLEGPHTRQERRPIVELDIRSIAVSHLSRRSRDLRRERPKGGFEVPHGGDDGPRLGEVHPVPPDADQVRLDLQPALLADRGEMVDRCRPQRSLGAPICLQPGDEERQKPDAQQRSEQPVPQRELSHGCGARRSGSDEVRFERREVSAPQAPVGTVPPHLGQPAVHPPDQARVLLPGCRDVRSWPDGRAGDAQCWIAARQGEDSHVVVEEGVGLATPDGMRPRRKGADGDQDRSRLELRHVRLLHGALDDRDLATGGLTERAQPAVTRHEDQRSRGEVRVRQLRDGPALFGGGDGREQQVDSTGL